MFCVSYPDLGGCTVWGEYIQDTLLTVGCLLVVVLLILSVDVFFCMSMLFANSFIMWHASALNNTLHWNLSIVSEGTAEKNDEHWKMTLLESFKGVYFLSSLSFWFSDFWKVHICMHMCFYMCVRIYIYKHTHTHTNNLYVGVSWHEIFNHDF